MSTSSGLPATGCDFPLTDFEAAMRADEEVLAVLYLGSQGRGEMDRYSDLDIDLWVTAGAFAQPEATLRKMMGRLGRIQFVYSRGPAYVTGFVGADWQRVDLSLHDPGDTKVHGEYARGRVAKDVNGVVTALVEAAPSERVTTSVDEARGTIEEAIDGLLYLTLHNARGASWSAAGEIAAKLEALYALLARTRGRQSYGFRYVEELLSLEEREMLRQAWPRRVDRQEVRRAAGDLWTWTRHVWREVEEALGRSLGIEIDEAAMLAAMERMYRPGPDGEG